MKLHEYRNTDLRYSVDSWESLAKAYELVS